VSALCDDIVIVSNGRVVAQGNAQQLLDRSGKSSLEEAFVHLSGEGDSPLTPTAAQGMAQ
ncbi:MAG: hypothetical protein SF172_11175, partial [Burkholderiales bacterium]|nr:hypothetical protein [Burkholderiales bacterium]